jgi:ubiquitin carboxyl-terminal hydrolase 4/11/15
VSPHQLKATLGRINPEYAGLAQQDAHELIELLLDKLHEDLNRVKKKPYTEKVEWDGVAPECEVAEQSWATHGRREDSVVRDLMGSLMRYQLTCADCGKVSLSFEYHTTLQVRSVYSTVCPRSLAVANVEMRQLLSFHARWPFLG